MALVHISLRLPLVLRTDSLALDLIFHCTKIPRMYKYHRAARSSTVSVGNRRELWGPFSDCLLKGFKAWLWLGSSEAAQGTFIL